MSSYCVVLQESQAKGYLEGWNSLAVWPLRSTQIRSVTFTCCQQTQAVSGRKTRAALTVAIASEVKLHSNADVSAR